jgi:uncharacterized membrane protein
MLDDLRLFELGCHPASGDAQNMPCSLPARHWRIVNEIPTLLMLAIVILVVVKSFDCG